MQIIEPKFNHITSITTVTNTNQAIEVIHAIKAGVVILGAYVKDRLVGVVKVTNKKDCYYFSRLAVLPAVQGKGIASSLVAYIEKVAAEKNMNLVQCIVRKSETDNIRLYNKLGYSITKEEITTSPTGFVMATVTMEKKINPY